MHLFLDDTDFEGTVQDFEFTRRASRQIRTVINSDDFEDMDSDAIFHYLYNQMEIASFKDYLRRYLYERAGIREPFREVPEEVYREIIMYSFEENAAPHSFEPTSTKWSASVKGWLRHDSVRRSVVFLLGFGLRMTDRDVSEFLTKVLKDEDFDFSNRREAVFWYCFRNGLSYADADALLKTEEKAVAGRQTDTDTHMATGSQASPSFPEGFMIESVTDAEANRLYDKPVLLSYLFYLEHSGIGENRRKTAYRYFCSLLEMTKQEIRKMSLEDQALGEIASDDVPENVTSADVEKVICSGIPLTKSGNLQKASASRLSRQFQNFRLSRQRIDGILKKQLHPDRYDLITLLFFLYSQKEYEFPEDCCREYMEEMNRILRECGMMQLHPVNPYEAFVLMCLLTEGPLATYADVWEMSYDGE